MYNLQCLKAVVNSVYVYVYLQCLKAVVNSVYVYTFIFTVSHIWVDESYSGVDLHE